MAQKRATTTTMKYYSCCSLQFHNFVYILCLQCFKSLINYALGNNYDFRPKFWPRLRKNLAFSWAKIFCLKMAGQLAGQAEGASSLKLRNCLKAEQFLKDSFKLWRSNFLALGIALYRFWLRSCSFSGWGSEFSWFCGIARFPICSFVDKRIKTNFGSWNRKI